MDLHPTAPVIRRPGQISAWDNEDFVAAVKATGGKNLIMAGVTVVRPPKRGEKKP